MNGSTNVQGKKYLKALSIYKAEETDKKLNKTQSLGS